MNKKLFILFSLLWIADTVFTLMFVHKYGLESEANPMIRHIMAYYGPVTFCVLKLITWGGWYLAQLNYKHKRNKEVHWALNAALVLIMLPVVTAGGIMAL